MMIWKESKKLESHFVFRYKMSLIKDIISQLFKWVKTWNAFISVGIGKDVPR